jgi:uncharacterized membrane protein YraQ (UPF0718 family)
MAMQAKRKPGPWLFLALVILAYAATALWAPDLARQALAAFPATLGQLAAVLALVFLLMFLGERFLTPARTRAWLGPSSGMKGWLLAAAAGVLSTGPIYPWYGLLADLRTKGMRTGLVAVLLYARAIKLPLLPLMAHYFGLRYTVVLVLGMVGFSLLNGLAMERLNPPPKSP